MTTQTPTQIATEIMKGCGKKWIKAKYTWKDDGTRSDKPFKVDCCSNRLRTDLQFLCQTCKKVNQTHKQDWEGELDNIEGVKAGIPLHKADEECDCCMYEAQISLNRISELTQALKILEGANKMITKKEYEYIKIGIFLVALNYTIAGVLIGYLIWGCWLK